MKDTTDISDDGTTALLEVKPSALVELHDAELATKDVMTENVLCVTSDQSMLSVAQSMAKHGLSCVIVLDAETPKGIFTERDVLKEIGKGYRAWSKTTVAEKMSTPLISASCDLPILEASALMRSSGIKRLPIVSEGKLLGLVTQTDIGRALMSLSPFGDVADIMSTDVVTVDASGTVTEAALVMSSRRISCVVPMCHDEPVGILTEKDVLRRVAALQRDPDKTLVAAVATFPLVTVTPNHSVLSASRMMDVMHIHRLVVQDGNKICGIVSQTDILDSIRHKLKEIEEARLLYRSTVRKLADAIVNDLSSVESLVQEAIGRAAVSCDTPGATVECQSGLRTDHVLADRRSNSHTRITEPLGVIHKLISAAQGKLEEMAGMA